MKARLLLVAKWVAYPAFYVFCLSLFGYLTFPFDRLKDRIIVEFERSQRKGSSGATPTLTIEKLTSYWFTGIEAKGVRVTYPPDDASSSAAMAGFGAKDDSPKKDTVLAIDDVHVRVRILPLLIGRVRLDFGAEAFGGSLDGTLPVGGSSGTVELELEKIDLGQVTPLVDLVGLPMKGVANGKLELTANEGKFNKSNGAFELTIADVSVGDGKAKLKGLVAVPEAKIGELAISAEAKDGVLKVTKLNAAGHDLELAGDGKVQIREPWNASNADIYLRFKFADGYRTKNDDTKSLLGDPNSSVPPMLEMDSKVKRAKRSDGFYGWHVHGMLRRLQFDPWSADTPASSGSGGRPTKKGGDGMQFGGGPKKPGGTPFGQPASRDVDAPPASPEEGRPPPPSPPPPMPLAPPPPQQGAVGEEPALRPPPAPPPPPPRGPEPEAEPPPPDPNVPR